MTKSNKRKICWLLSILYLAFIYATLGIMPTVWDKLDNLSKGKIVPIIYLIYIAYF
jgi:hypothetical protein